MKRIAKYAAAAALTGALSLAAATPSQARWHGGHGWGGAAIGFGAGALVGAAVASSAYPGYYSDYAYEPGYGYEPGPYNSYGYAPAYDSYRTDGAPACAGSLGYGRPDYTSC
jgi:hypothetical protein